MGNPVGGLVYTNAFGEWEQSFEWMSFVDLNSFCFRACVNGISSSQAALCQHIYDEQGCEWNMPSAFYDNGSGNAVFEDCDGDNALPPGVYGSSTWYQSEGNTPSAHPAPASSNCAAASSPAAALGTVGF